MSDKQIVDAARALKRAHDRADRHGGDAQASLAKALERLLEAVEPDEEEDK